MDDYEDIEDLAKSNRRRMKILAIVGVGIFAIPLVWVGWSYHKRQQRIAQIHQENRDALEIKPAQIESLKKQLAEKKSLIATQQQAWKRAVTHEELAKLQPGSSPCDMPRLEGSPYVQRDSIGANYFKESPGRIAAGEAFGLPYTSVLADIETLEKKLAGGTATQNDVYSYELPNAIAFIVVDKETKPVVSDAGSFASGHLLGRAYVYSATAQRITCAGDLDVSNSEKIQIDYKYMAGNYADEKLKAKQSAEWKVSSDFEAQITRAVAAQLRAVN